MRKRINESELVPPEKCRFPKNDISGMKFNKLTVIRFLGRKDRKSYYECVCECGNRTVVYKPHIVNGKTKSCGCYQAEKNWQVHFIDMTGKRWGKLTAVRFLGRIKRRTFWTMKCDCGNTKDVSLENLLSGNVNSCGCIKREMLSKKSGEAHHWWRGGILSKYPTRWNKDLKERIRNRDSRCCQYPECQYSDMFGGRKLDIHHINGDKENCSDINLISLCHSHHMSVESCWQDWQEYFYEITRDYEYA